MDAAAKDWTRRTVALRDAANSHRQVSVQLRFRSREVLNGFALALCLS